MSMRSQPHQLNWNGHDLDSLNLIVDSINDMLGELYQQVSTLASTPASTGSSSLPDPVTVAHGGTGAITAAAARAALGLAIGTNVEAQSSELDGLAALAANGLIARTAAATYAARTLAAGAGITSITNADGVAGNPTIVGITKLATSVTGAQNNYAPGLLGHTVEYWSGAADAAFTGLAGGVAGQLYTLKNTGTKVATFANQSASSSAGNKFTNFITSGVTPVAPRGFITFQYDGTDWQILAHEQGDWIANAYASGDYTGGGAQTWTVDSGDVLANKYYVRGRQLFWVLVVATTSVGGTPNSTLLAKYPNGYAAPNTTEQTAIFGFGSDNGVRTAIFGVVNNTSTTQIGFVRLDGASWTGSTNNSTVDILIPGVEIT